MANKRKNEVKDQKFKSAALKPSLFPMGAGVSSFSLKLFGWVTLLVLFACNDSTPRPSATREPNIKVADSPLLAHQENPFAPVDISPMDIAYLPADYTIMKMQGNAPDLPVARVIYSRPHRQGRTIFGGLIKYGEPWRLGANEATEIEFFQTVTIQDKKVLPGKFILYCLPEEDKWTIVFNANLYSWGLKPDANQDKYRFEVPVSAIPQVLEYFTMSFEQSPEGYELVMGWENQVARLPIKF